MTASVKFSDIPGEEGSVGEEIIQDDDFSYQYHLEESDSEDDKTSESGDEEYEESREEPVESEENHVENEEESVTDAAAQAAAQAAAPVNGQRKRIKRSCPSQYDTR
jgi:hypothetical protein